MRTRNAQARGPAQTLLRQRRLVMGYDAFVSYSHAADGQLAPALQLGLQRLARPWYRARASAVFRDETGLAVSPQLWTSIARALDDSEWFVVLCSPEAAGSEWVGREINHWLAHKAPDRILLVLTDGELVWEGRCSDFDPSRSTALPPALFGHFGDEPRHLDLRWARGEEQLDVRHVRFRAAVAELAAPIRSMAREELEAEDVRQHRRTMLLARGATSVLVLLLTLALALGGLAWQQRDTARHATVAARRQANATLGEALASQALNATHSDRVDLAMLLAVEGYRVDPGRDELSALLTASVDQPNLERVLHGLTDAASALAFSPDGGTLAAASVTGQVRLWDTRSGRPLDHQPEVAATPASDDPLSHVNIAFADEGRVLAVSSGGTGTNARPRFVSVVDVATGRVRFSLPDITGSGDGWSVSADAPVFAAADMNGTIQVWDIRSDRRIASIVTGATQGKVALSPDAKSVAMARDWGPGDAQLWNVANGQPIGPGCATGAGSTSGGGSTGTRAAPVDPGLNVVVLADDVTVRTWGADAEGTTGAINTCHADTGKLDTQLLGPTGIAGSIPISGEFVGVSPDGTIVASRSGDGTINLLDVKSSGQPIGNPVRAPLVIHLDPLVSAAVVFSPDGQRMSAIEQDGDVRIWRTTDTIWHAEAGLPYDDPSGHVAVTRSGDVIDLRTRKNLGHLPGAVTLALRPTRESNITSQIRLSPDDRSIAVLGTDGLQLFSVNGTGLHANHTYPTVASAWSGMDGAVAFTPDSRTVVFARAGGLVELIDTDPGKPRSRTLAQPNGQVPSDAAVSPDGSLLAVLDEGVRLWDLPAAQLLGTIPIASGNTVSLTNRSLIVGSGVSSRTALRFDLDPRAWQHRACTVANRDLTRAEWAHYLPGLHYHNTCPRRV